MNILFLLIFPPLVCISVQHPYLSTMIMDMTMPKPFAFLTYVVDPFKFRWYIYNLCVHQFAQKLFLGAIYMEFCRSKDIC